MADPTPLHHAGQKPLAPIVGEGTTMAVQGAHHPHVPRSSIDHSSVPPLQNGGDSKPHFDAQPTPLEPPSLNPPNHRPNTPSANQGHSLVLSQIDRLFKHMLSQLPPDVQQRTLQHLVLRSGQVKGAGVPMQQAVMLIKQELLPLMQKAYMQLQESDRVLAQRPATATNVTNTNSNGVQTSSLSAQQRQFLMAYQLQAHQLIHSQMGSHNIAIPQRPSSQASHVRLTPANVGGNFVDAVRPPSTNNSINTVASQQLLSGIPIAVNNSNAASGISQATLPVLESTVITEKSLGNKRPASEAIAEDEIHEDRVQIDQRNDSGEYKKTKHGQHEATLADGQPSQ